MSLFGSDSDSDSDSDSNVSYDSISSSDSGDRPTLAVPRGPSPEYSPDSPDSQSNKTWGDNSATYVNTLLIKTWRYYKDIACSGDGKRVAQSFTDASTITIYDTNDGEVVHTFNGGSVCSLALSGDGTRVALGKTRGRVVVCDAASGAQTLLASDLYSSTNVNTVAISKDGTKVATGGEKGYVGVFDAESGGCCLMWLSGSNAKVECVAFSNDGTRVASGDAGRVVVWDVATKTKLRKMAKCHTYVNSVAFSGDDTRVVSGGAEGSFVVWDASDGTMLTHQVFNSRDNGPVLSVSFSHDGTRVMSRKRSCVSVHTAHNCNVLKLRILAPSSEQHGHCVTFLGNTNDICYVTPRRIHVWREIGYRVTRPRDADDTAASSPAAQKLRSADDKFSTDEQMMMFNDFLPSREQSSVAVVSRFINSNKRVYNINTTREVLTRKNGHWYVDEGQTQLPRVVDATAADGGAAATAAAADGGEAAVHLQRLRL